MTYASTDASLPVPRRPYEIRRIGGGQDFAVPLDEMLLDLRVDSADENETVARAIRGMTDYFEGRTGWRLSPASYEILVRACVDGQVTVERGPFRALNGAWWWDCEDRTWQAVDINDCQVFERGREFDLLFSRSAAEDFPAPTLLRPFPIRIQFEAGFDAPGVTGSEVAGPAEDGMITSLKALVAVAYENREAGGAAGNWSGADPAKDFLLQRYRKFW